MRQFNNLAKVIKTARQKTKISQCDLSYALGYKNGQFISNIERGLCSLPARKITLAAKLLKISIDDIKFSMVRDYAATLDNVTAQREQK